MYAKLISGTLRSATKKVDYNGKTIFNQPEDVLLDMGYLPVTYTDVPTDMPEGTRYVRTSQYSEQKCFLLFYRIA